MMIGVKLYQKIVFNGLFVLVVEDLTSSAKTHNFYKIFVRIIFDNKPIIKRKVFKLNFNSFRIE